MLDKLPTNFGVGKNSSSDAGRSSSIGCASAWYADGSGIDPHFRRHYFVELPFSPADSRRAVVSYWRKNVHLVLVNCLGGLPRNNVDRLTDRARNDLKSVEGP